MLQSMGPQRARGWERGVASALGTHAGTGQWGLGNWPCHYLSLQSFLLPLHSLKM